MSSETDRKYYGLGILCLIVGLLFALFSNGTMPLALGNGGYVSTKGPLVPRGLAALGFSVAGALCILASALAGKKGKE